MNSEKHLLKLELGDCNVLVKTGFNVFFDDELMTVLSHDEHDVIWYDVLSHDEHDVIWTRVWTRV